MNWVDYIILGTIVLSALVGVARGLIRELLSLGTWIAALVIAWLFHPPVAELLTTQLSHPLVRQGAAFIGLVLLTLVAGSILAVILTALIDKVGLSAVNRMLGMIFGGARGVIIIAMAVYLAALTPAPSDPVWMGSLFIADFQAIGHWLISLTPPEIAGRLKEI